MLKRTLAIFIFAIAQLNIFLFAFQVRKAKDPAMEKIEKTISEAIRQFETKKETYVKEVLDLFEKKETSVRGKGNLELLNQIKKEKEAFLSQNREPSLFFITDQKRLMEKAKIELIKIYEQAIKDCVQLKLDFEAEEYTKELQGIKNGVLPGLQKLRQMPELPKVPPRPEPKDYFQANSYWADSRELRILQVTKREDNQFTALWYPQSKAEIREVSGTISENKFSWLAKNVKLLKGKSPGGNNFGTIQKDSIRMEWHQPQGKKGGELNLQLIHPTKTFENLKGIYKFVSGNTDEINKFQILDEPKNETPWLKLFLKNTSEFDMKDWGVSGDFLLFCNNNYDLYAIERKNEKQVRFSIYLGECKSGFKKTNIPSRSPDKMAIFDQIEEILGPNNKKAAFIKKMQELNPDFDGKIGFAFNGNNLQVLEFRSGNVTDISAIKMFPELQHLHCWALPNKKSKLKDFSHLKGMKLHSLNASNTDLDDISFLAEMPISDLYINFTKVSDLSPLKGKKMRQLNISNSKVKLLTPMAGASVREIFFNPGQIQDLKVLKTFSNLKTISGQPAEKWFEKHDLN
jgi:hypothetical protein